MKEARQLSLNCLPIIPALSLLSISPLPTNLPLPIYLPAVSSSLSFPYSPSFLSGSPFFRPFPRSHGASPPLSNFLIRQYADTMLLFVLALRSRNADGGRRRDCFNGFLHRHQQQFHTVDQIQDQTLTNGGQEDSHCSSCVHAASSLGDRGQHWDLLCVP